MDIAEKLYRLKHLLIDNNQNDAIIYIDEVDHRKYFNTNLDNPIINEIGSIACTLFITSSGTPNRKNIQHAKRYGIQVYPGDRDSFGWLTGCIQMSGDANAPIYVFG